MPSGVMSQRRSKLKPQEAALLAGEINKPSWESRNEGIHERVSFEDAIWGFDLAGGAYYKTPLRVTGVKPDSRADKAGIRPGDKLLRINDVDTSTLTIQQAHEMILESGVHLRLAVTAPEDEEDSYHCWQDAIEEGYDSEEERRKEKEKEEKRRVHCKVSSYWSLQWPWVSKRRIIYRESNCFMVPSRYEDKHRDLFSEQPTGLKTTDDVVLFGNKEDDKLKYRTGKTPPQSPITNGIDDKKPTFNGYNGKESKANNIVTANNSQDLEKVEEEVAEEHEMIADTTESGNLETKDNFVTTNGNDGINEEIPENGKIDDVTVNGDNEQIEEIEKNENGIKEELPPPNGYDGVIEELLENGDENLTHADEDHILDDILSDESIATETIEDKT